jgi:hypothetical protein
MWQFMAAWERFAADEANLTEFVNTKRKRRGGAVTAVLPPVRATDHTR